MRTTWELVLAFELDEDAEGWANRSNDDAPPPADEVRAHELAHAATEPFHGTLTRYAVNRIK